MNLPVEQCKVDDELLKKLTPKLLKTLKDFGYKDEVIKKCKITRVQDMESHFIYLASRWNAQYIFYTSRQTVQSSFSENGNEKLRYNEYASHFGMNSVKRVKLYDVEFQKNESHELYQGEVTGTYKAFHSLVTEMPNFLKEYCLNKNFNISKSTTFDTICDEYNSYAKKFTSLVNDELIQKEVNENIDLYNSQVEELIKKKVTPSDIEHFGLEYSYEQMDRVKNKLKYISVKIIEFEYDNDKHFICLDNLSDYGYFNKSLKIKGSGFLSKFFG